MQIEVLGNKLEITEVNPELARELSFLIVGKNIYDDAFIQEVIRAPNKVLASEIFINKHIGVIKPEKYGGYALGILPMKEFEVKLA